MMIIGEVVRQLMYQFTVGSSITPLPWQTLLYNLGYFLYLGAFPIAAFLLVEGAKKTSNQTGFLRRLFFAGIVVELPIVYLGLKRRTDNTKKLKRMFLNCMKQGKRLKK